MLIAAPQVCVVVGVPYNLLYYKHMCLLKNTGVQSHNKNKALWSYAKLGGLSIAIITKNNKACSVKCFTKIKLNNYLFF